MTQDKQHTSVKAYLAVFAALGVLTGLTATIASLGLPHGTAVTLAALISIAKCALIAWFFMHLRFESKGIYALVLGALFFLAVLILSVIPDIGVAIP